MKDKPLSPEPDKIEPVHDAWERTEHAIKTAAKHAPISTIRLPSLRSTGLP